MRNPLTIHIETKVGVVIILFWATLFTVVVIRAVSNFENFLVLIHAQTPILKSHTRVEHDQINRWIVKQGFNPYGDASDTVYTGGTPLFDEETGLPIDRYSYLVQKFPERPWKKVEEKGKSL